MVQSAISRRLLAATLLFALASFTACSNKKSSTAPPGTTPKELNSGALGNGAVYVDTLDTAGAFPYHCAIHTSMMGSVVVDAGSANTAAAVSITGFTFSPATVTVKPGGIVTWTNNDATNHTVTSN